MRSRRRRAPFRTRVRLGETPWPSVLAPHATIAVHCHFDVGADRRGLARVATSEIGRDGQLCQQRPVDKGPIARALHVPGSLRLRERSNRHSGTAGSHVLRSSINCARAGASNFDEILRLARATNNTDSQKENSPHLAGRAKLHRPAPHTAQFDGRGGDLPLAYSKHFFSGCSSRSVCAFSTWSSV